MLAAPLLMAGAWPLLPAAVLLGGRRGSFLLLGAGALLLLVARALPLLLVVGTPLQGGAAIFLLLAAPLLMAGAWPLLPAAAVGGDGGVAGRPVGATQPLVPWLGQPPPWSPWFPTHPGSSSRRSWRSGCFIISRWPTTRHNKFLLRRLLRTLPRSSSGRCLLLPRPRATTYGRWQRWWWKSTAAPGAASDTTTQVAQRWGRRVVGRGGALLLLALARRAFGPSGGRDGAAASAGKSPTAALSASRATGRCTSDLASFRDDRLVL